MKGKIAILLAITFMLSIPALAVDSKKSEPKTTTKTNTSTKVQVKTAEYEGIIIEATADQITVNTSNKKFIYETIKFNLSKTTKYENCTKADLAVGAQVKIKHSLAMTRSIPPQASAVSVKLLKKAEKTFNYKGKITEIVAGKDGKMILVEADDNRSSYKAINFTVNATTKLNNCKLDDLQVGAVVETTYGLMMTKSLPPITTAHSVKVIKAAAQTFKYVGTIKQVDAVDGYKLVTVAAKNASEINPEIRFVVSKDTKLENGTMDALKQGAMIEATYGLVMTKSLPPQTNAFSIKILKEEKQTFKYEGTIKEVNTNKDYIMLLVSASNAAENNKEIIFVVSKDTELKNIKSEDLKVGAKVKVTYGMVMTMSLPPQTAAFEIELMK